MKKTNTLMSSLRLMVAAMVVLFSYGTAMAQSISCNGDLQVSLQQDPSFDNPATTQVNEACFATLQLDDVLEGTIDPAALYTIQLLNGLNQVIAEQTGLTGDDSDDNDDNDGDGIVDDALVTPFGLEGQTVTYKVINEATTNACWGSIEFEDKAPPVLVAGNRLIECSDLLPPVGGSTVATDNCDLSPTVQLVDERTIDDDICDDGAVVIERDYIAVDDNGNTSAVQTQTITITRPATVTFPDDIAFSCEQYQANPAIIGEGPLAYVGLGLFPGTIAPAVVLDATVLANNQLVANGAGTVDVAQGGFCNYAVSSSDDILTTCGDADRVFKVLRTFTVFDWCTSSVVTTGTTAGADNIQVIKVVDINGPTIVLQDAFDASAANPGQHPIPCNFTGDLPIPAISDCGSTSLADIDLDVFINEDLDNDGIVDITDPAIANATVTRINGGTVISRIRVSVPGGLPLGDYVATYQVTDDCGNVAEETLDLTVVDNVAPTAICDEITDVNLSSDGLAVVQASVFDDGSYDNCGVERFEVRRMDLPVCVAGDQNFGPTVTFCCADVNTQVMVVFRVVDFFGNTNECMVLVNVQDKLPPVIISCPQPVKITCDEYISLGVDGVIATYFGDPVFSDNCGFTTTEQITPNVDNCNEGTIRRVTTASDANGSVTCTQTITIGHISNYVVEFPADVTITCDNDDDGQTDPTADGAGVPEIFFDDCELVGVSHEDQTFDVVVDACYKIIRQWTVINWCVVGEDVDQEVVEVDELTLRNLGILPFNGFQNDGNDVNDRTYRDSWNIQFQPGDNLFCQDVAPDTDPDLNPWDGYITYQQTIKVNDTEAPEVTAVDLDICIDDNTCSADVDLGLPAMDDCSGLLDVLITGTFQTETGIVNIADFTEDIDEDDAVGVIAATVQNVLPGVYEVTYTVTDNCGNTTIVTIDVTVRDCKLPTPYCADGIVIVTMPTTGTVEIWANDLDLGSFDNCPGTLKATFANPTAGVPTSYQGGYNAAAAASPAIDGITVTCADIPAGQNFVTYTVDVYFTDAAGNFDFCTTIIRVQSNAACTATQVVAVGGAVTNEDDAPVQDVDVNLNGSNSMMTANDGMYDFNSVPANSDVSIVPSRDDNPTNGVTTFDIVLISKHILGTQDLDSPYKRIAADANASGNISTLDLVDIRKVILYINDNFTNNSSYRFVDAAYTFSTNSPEGEDFAEVINYNNIAAAQMAGDFVAVKIGDVNGTAAMNNLMSDDAEGRTNGAYTFNVADRAVQAGETFTVAFDAAELVAGYQFTLNFNELEFVSVEGAVATEENFGTALLNKGVITASWNGQAVAGTQFEMTFTAKADAQLSELLAINSRYTNAEAYGDNGRMDVAIAFNGSVKANGFELYQNQPNPFAGATLIGFNLPEAGQATLSIQDVSGKQLLTNTANFAKGYNEVSVSADQLPATGVLYYTLKTENQTATKRMVIVE